MKRILSLLLLAATTTVGGAADTATARAAPSASPSRKQSVVERGLKYFGFASIDCGLDDPGDDEQKTNYIGEVAGFTNIGQMCVHSPEEVLTDRLNAFSRAGVRAILHIQGILFDHRKDPSTGSGDRVSLRADAERRWTDFVRQNRAALTPALVAALYVVDEPVWNGVTAEEFLRSLQIVKDSRLGLPTLAVEAYPVVNRIMVPDLLDWVGFDRYDSLDPATDPVWLADLRSVKAARTRPDQRIVVIASTQWLPYYEKDAGVRPADMEKVVKSYYRVAVSHPEVIALIGYLWPGGLDDPKQLGARRLPQNVQKKLHQIGQAILRKHQKRREKAP